MVHVSSCYFLSLHLEALVLLERKSLSILSSADIKTERYFRRKLGRCQQIERGILLLGVEDARHSRRGHERSDEEAGEPVAQFGRRKLRLKSGSKSSVTVSIFCINTEISSNSVRNT